MKKLMIAALALLASFAAFAAEKESVATPIVQDEIIDGLTAEVAALQKQLSNLSSAIAFIEKKCETDRDWRTAYHQGLAHTEICTNEFGIAYRVEIYNDGYVYANYYRTVKSVDPEAKAKEEAAKKALIAEKQAEMVRAMETANLPEPVAKRLEERRAAQEVKSQTVLINAR